MEDKTKYSFSRLDTYRTCKFKYLLRYVQKHYANTSSIATEFGSAVHKVEQDIAEYIMAGQPINYDKIISEFNTVVEGLKTKYPSDFVTKDKSDRTYSEKIEQYLTKDIYRLEEAMKRNPDFEIVGAEVPFEVKIGEHWFKGAIDRVLKHRNADIYVIQDVKTYPVEIEDADLKVPLQFVVYCMAAAQLYNIDPHSILCQYYLPLCSAVQNAGTDPEFIEKGLAEIEEIFANIAANDFEPNQKILCYWCEFCSANPNGQTEFKYLCPYFSHWRKDRKWDFSREFDWCGLEYNNSITEAYHKMCGLTKGGDKN